MSTEAPRQGHPTVPESPALNAWNAAVVTCAVVMAVFIPVDLLFGIATDREVFWANVAITLLFILDIPVNVYRMRGVRGGGSMVPAPGVGAYFGRWFVFDLLAAIPFGLLFGAGWLELLRLGKLAKVGHVMRAWRLRELRWANFLLLGFAVFWMALAAHWITCGWMALRGVPGIADPMVAYADALYWTVTTLTTVGYGDVVPATTPERLYAVGTMVVGLAFFGYLVGLIASVWARRDPARARFTANVEQLGQAVKYGDLPRELQERIYDYHYYLWKERLGYDESEFLAGLPPGLRAEAALHLKADLVERCDLFRGADPEFVKDIALHLRPHVLTPGDVLFRAGSEGREMYFIARGEVEVLSDDGRHLAMLGAGDFFGEIALVLDVARTATIRAVTYTDIYSVDRTAFERVVAQHPEVLERIREVAMSRHAETTGTEAGATAGSGA